MCKDVEHRKLIGRDFCFKEKGEHSTNLEQSVIVELQRKIQRKQAKCRTMYCHCGS
jgi:hypothetical protein